MEIWKDIKGFEGKYQVSNLGRVRCVGYDNVITTARSQYTRNVSPKIINGQINNFGYRCVELRKGNRFQIHRLVAEAFISNPENKRTVNHKDGNKLNNSVCNLEWATYSENIQHAYDTGLKEGMIGENHHHYGRKRGLGYNAKKVIDTETGRMFECVKDAADHIGVTYKHLSRMLSGARNNTSSIRFV